MPFTHYCIFNPRNSKERYITDAIGDFEEEMDSRGLFPFYVRFRLNYVAYQEEWQDVPTLITFRVFQDVLTYFMTMSEKEKHFDALSKVYIQFFMKDAVNTYWNSKFDCVFGVFSKLLDVLIFSSDSRRSLRCVDFLRKCKEVLKMDLRMIVARVYSNQRDFIVSCVSERFPSWNLGEGSGMERSYFYNRLKIESVLLLYGFKYRFGGLCFHISYRMLHSPRFKVPHKDFKALFSSTILWACSLRLQMAIELLIGIFYMPSYPQEKEILMNFLKVLWRAVPHPLISKIEMYSLLRPFYLCNCIKLSVLCNEYAKHNTIFPVPVFVEPRSLKHLAKLQVRTTLSKVDTIGDKAIDSLDIPATLKSYLKFEYFS